MPEIAMPQGTIRYREAGTGPAIVFLHGYLMDSRLWDGVVERLAGDFRCIAPDLPLGAHPHAMAPGTDLSLRGLGRLVAGFLEALDLHDVTLVGNDSGGGLAQIVAAEHPERLARLVLTPCDAFDNCPPTLFKPLKPAAHVPGLLSTLFQPLKLRAPRRLPFAYGLLTKGRLPHDFVDAWVDAYFADKGVRRDMAEVTRHLDADVMEETATKLAGFSKPVLLAWAREDRLFPFAHAERLAEILPDAYVAPIDDSRTWVMLDQPERTASLIREFVRSTAPAAAR